MTTRATSVTVGQEIGGIWGEENVGTQFNGTAAQNFVAPYIDLAPDMLAVLEGSAVRDLQAQGVTVLLSVLGNGNITWGSLPYRPLSDFAQWLRTEVVDRYGLDGIDIDDESGGSDAQNFVNVVGSVRNDLGGKLLTKALWADDGYFTVPVSQGFPNAGQTLPAMLDFGWTMAYGGDADAQETFVTDYHDEQGMPWDKLLVGVQAGPPDAGWMTSIETVTQVAAAVRSARLPVRGMMLFTFSQDIQQFTFSPQNSPDKLWPNPDDHQWQRTMSTGMPG